MTYEELMLFVVKQQKLTRNVLTCYEAGAFGFHLHRRFEELGIKNYVERPQDWDERGNKKAFSMVRIPTVDEERERAMSRQRQQLMRERQRVAGMGRGLRAPHNIHLTGKWQKGKAWAAIKVLAREWVIEMLEVFIKILNPLEEQELKLMDQLQEAARERKIPRGVGPLTFEILRREVGDWGRFNNRRQVSSSSLTSLIIGRQPRGTERAICFSGRHLEVINLLSRFPNFRSCFTRYGSAVPRVHR